MNVDLGKGWCLVTIWNQTSNVMVHNALNTEGVYTTSSISKLFVNIRSEGTKRKTLVVCSYVVPEVFTPAISNCEQVA